MTVRECYEQMGADYEGVLGRLRSEVLIKKFAKKFLDDGSFRSLKDNLVQKIVMTMITVMIMIMVMMIPVIMMVLMMVVPMTVETDVWMMGY